MILSMIRFEQTIVCSRMKEVYNDDSMLGVVVSILFIQANRRCVVVLCNFSYLLHSRKCLKSILDLKPIYNKNEFKEILHRHHRNLNNTKLTTINTQLKQQHPFYNTLPCRLSLYVHHLTNLTMKIALALAAA